MTVQITNQLLRERLMALGFRCDGITPKNNLVFRHPDSDCIFILPENKSSDLAAPADMLSVRSDLENYDILQAEAFEQFMESGEVPATSP